MDLNIQDKLFVVCGATSGFGRSVAESLIKEGAQIIIIARTAAKVEAFCKACPGIESIVGDVTTDAVIANIIRKIGKRKLDGILVNAGGPPAKSFIETEVGDWDDAYESILRWKVKLTNFLLPIFIEQKYGRLVFIESVSVKQPIENLVLSNSLRLAVVGFAKTLSQEIAHHGITANILAPGYHDTGAMERLFTKKSKLLGITEAEAKTDFESEIKSGSLGNPSDLASLATWLLSPKSSYVTGQTISVDGGLLKSTF
jgi:3-oxoacyl-[acyl-carrier protein] reductase